MNRILAVTPLFFFSVFAQARAIPGSMSGGRIVLNTKVFTPAVYTTGNFEPIMLQLQAELAHPMMWQGLGYEYQRSKEAAAQITLALSGTSPQYSTDYERNRAIAAPFLRALAKDPETMRLLTQFESSTVEPGEGRATSQIKVFQALIRARKTAAQDPSLKKMLDLWTDKILGNNGNPESDAPEVLRDRIRMLDHFISELESFDVYGPKIERVRTQAVEKRRALQDRWLQINGRALTHAFESGKEPQALPPVITDYTSRGPRPRTGLARPTPRRKSGFGTLYSNNPSGWPQGARDQLLKRLVESRRPGDSLP